MIFAIANILLGAMGLMSMLSSLMYLLVPAIAQSNPMIKSLMENPTYVTCLKVMTIPTMLGSLVQVGSGLGLLKSREWARKAAAGFGLYFIVASFAGAYVNYRYLFPAMAPELAKTIPDEAARNFANVIGVLSAATGALFGLVYGSVMTIMLMRAKVRVYCIAASSTPGQLIA